MFENKTGEIEILNTTKADFDSVILLFENAMKLHGKNGYKVWQEIDEKSLEKDMENQLQYKIVQHDKIRCLFSIQYSDPFIWREKEIGDAIYLHRIVVNQLYKGKRHFEKVLNWTKKFAMDKNLKFVRMDTWADNSRLIEYYQTFGFEFLENYKTPDEPELPIQNRNLEVALLEMKLNEQ